MSFKSAFIKAATIVLAACRGGATVLPHNKEEANAEISDIVRGRPSHYTMHGSKAAGYNNFNHSSPDAAESCMAFVNSRTWTAVGCGVVEQGPGQVTFYTKDGNCQVKIGGTPLSDDAPALIPNNTTVGKIISAKQDPDCAGILARDIHTGDIIATAYWINRTAQGYREAAPEEAVVGHSGQTRFNAATRSARKATKQGVATR